ncbi:ImmA/IrrE family metallo-endopeptidase [Listeria seeligeri]|uniref:ImmA/IrrE family metallo-endopeptidase n=1 Tax=Listeria seeligeri TaxID=1640 RepID=UPI001941A896|nr:ImmA/IrrE family metallo-endopeptidase [Listeria seeligeri]MBM5677590.1 ImmA/IrrE family metallo-endopeptidase [Listeria seeligeri]
MNGEFLVPTGWVIKEYIECQNMSQKEFSFRLGVSEKHVSNLLKGKTRLTEEMALKIETILTPTPASYWLNYESKYQEYIARQKFSEVYSAKDLKIYANRFHFKEVFSGLNWDMEKQAKEMLKILRIARFENFYAAYNEFVNVNFMEDGGEKEAIAIWLGLAREEIEVQNKKEIAEKTFKKENLEQDLYILKNIALNEDYIDSIRSARKFLNFLGVYLVICEPVINCKVRGALTSYEGIPTIFISGRFKTHDNVWFALIHEIAHLLMHYDSDRTIISFEDSQEKMAVEEKEANLFSRAFFINEQNYKEFIGKYSNAFSDKLIKDFAITQNVLPGVVVGRMQHDKVIPFDKFNHLKKSVE